MSASAALERLLGTNHAAPRVKIMNVTVSGNTAQEVDALCHESQVGSRSNDVAQS